VWQEITDSSKAWELYEVELLWEKWGPLETTPAEAWCDVHDIDNAMRLGRWKFFLLLEE